MKRIALSVLAILIGGCDDPGGGEGQPTPDAQQLCTQLAQQEATCWEEEVDSDTVADCMRVVPIIRSEAMAAAWCKANLPCDYSEEEDEACWANVKSLPEHDELTRACEACGDDAPMHCRDGVSSWKPDFAKRLTACFAQGCGEATQLCIAAETAPYFSSDEE